MIIVKTPLRMSYVGGGSDLPSYYREHGGAVISTAVQKYIYIMVKSRFEEGIRLSYSKTENVTDASAVEHPLVRNAIKLLEINDNLEIVSMADIPSTGSGMGSSSTFSVGLLKGLYAFQGRTVPTQKLAELACHLEINMCSNPIGKQDQYAAAFGGLRVYKFNSDDSVSQEPVLCNQHTISELNDQTLAFHIGGNRNANEILREQSISLSDRDKAKNMSKMVDLVWDLKCELELQSTVNFGAILHENWMLKREISRGITNHYIDDLYQTAIGAGATGGKLLGAGAGGFMIFHAPNNDVKSRILKRFFKLRQVYLPIETSGSTLIFNQES